MTNHESDIPEISPLKGVLSATGGTERLPIALERVNLDDPESLGQRDRLDIIADALESGQQVMVTREGRMIGLVIPITLGDIMTRSLERDPEWAEQLRNPITE